MQLRGIGRITTHVATIHQKHGRHAPVCTAESPNPPAVFPPRGRPQRALVVRFFRSMAMCLPRRRSSPCPPVSLARLRARSRYSYSRSAQLSRVTAARLLQLPRHTSESQLLPPLADIVLNCGAMRQLYPESSHCYQSTPPS